ncbi:MAG: helical backbone metal receptor [Polaribacter sp.]|uniref:ABC transporter substrate-binding protein n=1 Tax=Polaribacter sp. TaxID=1920175 RepID=UPI002F35E277
MKTYQDQIGSLLEFDKRPKRIISLVPSLTELLVDLGLEESIVGLTKFCIHPNYLKEIKTIVGGTKNINIEKIKTLKPDIILCNKEENTKEIVKLCKQVAPTHVSDIYTIDDTLELIKLYGNLFYKKTEAKEIIRKINFELTDFLQFINTKEIKKVAYFIWKTPWMIAANNTFINHLLQLNKFDNIYQNKERYPEIELDKIKLKGNLDFLFLSSEPYPFKEKDVSEIEQITNSKAFLVDGEMFSWYGSRLIKAFEYFKTLHQ